jgi:nicotinamidase-related amidase
MGNKAIIIIDYTNDFVADAGSLTCGKPAQEIEQTVILLTKNFIENKDYVVFAVDVHDENDPFHPETKLFPPHNIRHTNGRNLFGGLQTVFNQAKDLSNVHWMDKTRYSAFAGTDLDIKLKERRIEELHLIGVCTDICVLHTAVDAYNKGYKIVIYRQAVASFNAAGHEWALSHFKNTLGAEIR